MSYSKDLREEAVKYRKAGHTLRETSEIFGAGETAISRWEKQYDSTGDLSNKPLQRQARKLPPEKVAAYQEKIADISPEKIAYVDETGLDRFYTREYAYAPRGKTVEGLVHRKKRLLEIAERYQHTLIFLPPYFPELNPIEKLWAWLKRMIASFISVFSSLDDAISFAFQVR